MSKDFKLPDLNKIPINFVDATPDKDYALRILKSYRDNCDCKFIMNNPTPLIEEMNRLQDERAKILDKAIEILEKNGE